jgi:serine/threonine-protein kinase RsbW
MPKDELRVSLSPPRLSTLRDLARMVEGFGAAHGLPESKTYMLNLVLDELVANAVNYGFDGVAEPRIDIALWVSGTLLVLTMVDNGRRFDPTESASPDLTSPLDERAVGGLGLHLVGTFADRVTYQFTEGRNRLTLEHNYTPTGPALERDTPMDIEVVEERHDGVLVLSPVGRLDSGNVVAFESSVMQRIGGGERRLVFDLSRLDFISSSGLRVLLLATKALKTGTGTLVVCGMKPHIEDVFRISGFDRLISVEPSRAAALEASA